MGVARFRAEFLSKMSKGEGQSIPINRINKIDHLMIDTNTILHEAASYVYAYDNNLSDEDREMLENILRNNSYQVMIEDYYIPEVNKRISDAISTFFNFSKKGIKTIIIAVDGVAPAAKINQQRQRRFTPGDVVYEYPDVFSSSLITPGTDFMARVHIGITELMEKLKNQYLDTEFIYSSYEEYGEGEQKMFHICEDIYNKDVRNRGDIYATFGNDSDIVSLALLRPFRTLMITFDNYKKKWSYVDSDELKDYACTRLISNTNRRLPCKLAIQDFVLMIMLVGNDFLPRTTMTMDVGKMVNLCIKCHIGLEGNITTEDNKINYPMFRKFIRALSKYEYAAIKEMSGRKNMKYPSPVYQHPDVVGSETEEEFRNNFRYFWYKYYASPKSSLGCKLLGLEPFNYNSDKEIEYRLAKMEEENVKCVSDDWIEGMGWVLDYYNNREASRIYVYKHLFTPLMEDVSAVKTIPEIPKHHEPGEKYIDSKDQLMSVLSPDKFYLLDKENLKRVSPGGDLEYLAPYDYNLGIENITEEKYVFMAKKKIPTIDSKKILI